MDCPISVWTFKLNSDQYNYTFDNVAFAAYAVIAVFWLDSDDSNSATNQHTLGAYGGTDSIAVTVSKIDYSKTGLGVSTDLSLATP